MGTRRLFAVVANYQGERVYCDTTGVFQTAPTGSPFGPLIRDAYFTALADTRLSDVQIMEV